MNRFCIYCGTENLDEANFCRNCGKALNVNDKNATKDIRLKEYDRIINLPNDKALKSLRNTAADFIGGYLENVSLSYFNKEEMTDLYTTIAIGTPLKTELTDDYEFLAENRDIIKLLAAALLKATVYKSENQIRYTLSDVTKKLLVLLSNQADSSEDEEQKTISEIFRIRSKYNSMTYTEILENFPSES